MSTFYERKKAIETLVKFATTWQHCGTLINPTKVCGEEITYQEFGQMGNEPLTCRAIRAGSTRDYYWLDFSGRVFRAKPTGTNFGLGWQEVTAEEAARDGLEVDFDKIQGYLKEQAGRHESAARLHHQAIGAIQAIRTDR